MTQPQNDECPIPLVRPLVPSSVLRSDGTPIDPPRLSWGKYILYLLGIPVRWPPGADGFIRLYPPEAPRPEE